MSYCTCDDPLGVGLYICPDCGLFYSELSKQTHRAITAEKALDEFCTAYQNAYQQIGELYLTPETYALLKAFHKAQSVLYKKDSSR